MFSQNLLTGNFSRERLNDAPCPILVREQNSNVSCSSVYALTTDGGTASISNISRRSKVLLGGAFY